MAILKTIRIAEDKEIHSALGKFTVFYSLECKTEPTVGKIRVWITI